MTHLTLAADAAAGTQLPAVVQSIIGLAGVAVVLVVLFILLKHGLLAALKNGPAWGKIAGAFLVAGALYWFFEAPIDNLKAIGSIIGSWVPGVIDLLKNKG